MSFQKLESCRSWALSWLGLELGSRWPRSQSQASAVHMSAGRLPTLIQSLQREQHADYWHCPDNSVPQLLAEDIFVLSLKPTYTQRRDVSIQVGKILFFKKSHFMAQYTIATHYLCALCAVLETWVQKFVWKCLIFPKRFRIYTAWVGVCLKSVSVFMVSPLQKDMNRRGGSLSC